MSVSAETLFGELLQGGRVYEVWKQGSVLSFKSRGKRAVILRRHDGTKQTIQHSPVFALVRRGHLQTITWSGGRQEWQLTTH
jgi:hypothetical protein